jgi:crossover junction endonuclease MUS81
MLQLVVDTREAKLHKLFTEFLASDEGVQIKQEQMDVGDVAIYQTDAEDNRTLLLAFERKSMPDLAASIKDGRYKEQKQRLLAALPPHRITYIIEGGCFVPHIGEHGLGRSVFVGMYINTMYRDKIHVVHVHSSRETASWIVDIVRKLVTKPDAFDDNAAIGGANTYLHACKVKVKRRENLDASTCYLMQLAQIPSISHKLAENIAKVYPNMMVFVQAIQPLSKTEAVNLLSEIPLIGKKKAEIIHDYLRPST